MALLGTLWDKLSARTLAGGPATTTYQHSLGATPDFALPILRSFDRQTVAPSLIAEGGNASLATVGVLLPSMANASAPTAIFDLFVVKVGSAIA